jgi:hypothetical protein
MYDATNEQTKKKTAWANPETFDEIKPMAFGKPVSIVDEKTNEAAAQTTNTQGE